MPRPAEPEIAVPDTEALAPGGGPSFRRILVPIREASEAVEALAVAALLTVHPRPKVARNAGR